MKVSNNLKKLAKEFIKKNHQLYIVGGFVRDSLLGRDAQDIDLSSAMPLEDVENICKSLKFDCKLTNKHLGTLSIFTKKEKYEYTRFRKESYNGKHSPEKIEFVDDIESDASRRDFTINAIYYDIVNDQIIDLCGGRKDLNKGIIRTVRAPQVTLKDDGLRILRAIRFSSTYNFKIDRRTRLAMKIFRQNLLGISKERILSELKLCATADLKYGIINNVFWENIIKLDLFPLLFNRLVDTKRISKLDIANFYKLPKDARITDFYFIVLKYFLKSHIKHTQLCYAINMILGMDGIKESTATIRLIEKIYLIYQNIECDVDSLNASINYLRLTDTSKQIIYSHLTPNGIEVLNKNISLVEGHNLPTSLSQLKVSAKDLIAKEIEPRYISNIMNALYNQVIELKVSNSKEDLINLAIEINKTFCKLTTKKEK